MQSSLTNQNIKSRGPLIGQLAEGTEVVYYDAKSMKSTSIKTGKHFYVKPGNLFYLKTANNNENIKLVLFEIK